MCTVLLPPGVNPIAVKNISYHATYPLSSRSSFVYNSYNICWGIQILKLHFMQLPVFFFFFAYCEEHQIYVYKTPEKPKATLNRNCPNLFLLSADRFPLQKKKTPLFSSLPFELDQ